jgi:nucleotide-binding universal stress UspA family protein
MMMWLVLLVLLAVVAGVVGGREVTVSRLHHRDQGPKADRPERVRRILLPFTGSSISRRAFDAAVRLARVEHATLMPCYLATVPLTLPLDAALPAQCLRAMPLLEVIEQRAASQEVAVDARIVRGRTYRDALRRILGDEQFDRVIVSADHNQGAGFSGQDLVWLLDRADAEVLILRPANADHREIAASPSA